MIHMKPQASSGSSLIKQMNLAATPAFAEGRSVSEALGCGALLTSRFLAHVPGPRVLQASCRWPGHPSNDLSTEGYSLFSLLFLLKQKTENKKTPW